MSDGGDGKIDVKSIMLAVTFLGGVAGWVRDPNEAAYKDKIANMNTDIAVIREQIKACKP